MAGGNVSEREVDFAKPKKPTRMTSHRLLVMTINIDYFDPPYLKSMFHQISKAFDCFFAKNI